MSKLKSPESQQAPEQKNEAEILKVGKVEEYPDGSMSKDLFTREYCDYDARFDGKNTVSIHYSPTPMFGHWPASGPGQEEAYTKEKTFDTTEEALEFFEGLK